MQESAAAHGDKKRGYVSPTFNRRQPGVRPGRRKNGPAEHPAVSKCSSSASYIIDRACLYKRSAERKNTLFTPLSSTAGRRVARTRTRSRVNREQDRPERIDAAAVYEDLGSYEEKIYVRRTRDKDRPLVQVYRRAP